MMMMIPVVLVIAAALVAVGLRQHRKSGRQGPDSGRTETSQQFRDRDGQPWR